MTISRPPIRIRDIPDQTEEHQRYYRELIGDESSAIEATAFVTGPSCNKKMLLIAFQTITKQTVTVAMDRTLIEAFAGCIAVTWQHISDSEALEGQPRGRA